jgi:hypothetical protein
MRFLALSILLLAAAVIVPAQMMSEHNIEAGKSVFVKGSRLTIEFVEVVEDSRCPRYVNCIWAGNAKVKLLVSRGKAAPKEIELNTGIEPRAVTVFGYELMLKGLTPYPDNSKPSRDTPKAVISVKTVKK